MHAGSIRLIVAGAALLAIATGCSDGIFCPDGCGSNPPPTQAAPAIPSPTSAENVIEAIAVIYNDKVRIASDRSEAYATLFDPSFIFRFQAADVDSGLPPAWQLEEELAANRAMFNAQDHGDIYSLELRVTHDPAIDVVPSIPGSEGWKQVFASNVYLRLMLNPNEGVEVNGGQGVFVFSPPVNGEWKIAAWMDLPVPTSGRGSNVESGTWGQIKYRYSPHKPEPRLSQLHLPQP